MGWLATLCVPKWHLRCSFLLSCIFTRCFYTQCKLFYASHLQAHTSVAWTASMLCGITLPAFSSLQTDTLPISERRACPPILCCLWMSLIGPVVLGIWLFPLGSMFSGPVHVVGVDISKQALSVLCHRVLQEGDKKVRSCHLYQERWQKLTRPCLRSSARASRQEHLETDRLCSTLLTPQLAPRCIGSWGMRLRASHLHLASHL